MMDFFKKLCNLKEDKGFSLLELLLSIGTIGAVLVVSIEFGEDFLKQKRSISISQHMEEVYDASYSYAVDNFVAINALIPNAGDAVLLDGLTAAANNQSIDELIATGDLPATFSNSNSLNRDVLVFFVKVGNSNLAVTPPITTRIEVITMTVGEPLPEDMVIEAAQEMGGFAGVWSGLDRDLAAGDTRLNLESIFGLWSYPIANFVAEIPVASGPTADVAEGHLGTYRFVNFEDELGDYLYNNTVAGASDNVNRMFQDIEMNAFNIDGVDNFVAANNITVNNVFANGVVGVRGDLQTTRLATSGDVRSGGGLNPDGANAYSLDVEGNLVTSNIDFSGSTGQYTVRVTGDINTTTLNGSDISVVGNTNIDNLETLGNTDVSIVSMDLTSLVIGGNSQLTAGTVDGNNAVDVQINGRADAQGFTSSGNLDVNSGDIDITGNSVFSDLDIGSRFECGSGC